jgi:hypothetical protein
MGVHASKIPLISVTKKEPTVEFIHQLARDGLSKMDIQEVHFFSTEL